MNAPGSRDSPDALDDLGIALANLCWTLSPHRRRVILVHALTRYRSVVAVDRSESAMMHAARSSADIAPFIVGRCLRICACRANIGDRWNNVPGSEVRIVRLSESRQRYAAEKSRDG